VTVFFEIAQALILSRLGVITKSSAPDFSGAARNRRLEKAGETHIKLYCGNGFYLLWYHDLLNHRFRLINVTRFLTGARVLYRHKVGLMPEGQKRR